MFDFSLDSAIGNAAVNDFLGNRAGSAEFGLEGVGVIIRECGTALTLIDWSVGRGVTIREACFSIG
jgi:hypothetical protein